MQKYKKIYESLMESEDLYVLFEDMTGEWDTDKHRFIELQKELDKYISEIKVDLDDIE